MIYTGVGARLLVDDFERCFDFYTETLGFSVTWGSRKGPYVSFGEREDGKPVMAIFKKSHMPEYPHYEPATGFMNCDKAVLCIGSEDVDADYERLKASGVEFMGEPVDIEKWYLRCVYLRDPEGNLIEISQGL